MNTTWDQIQYGRTRNWFILIMAIVGGIATSTAQVIFEGSQILITSDPLPPAVQIVSAGTSVTVDIPPTAASPYTISLPACTTLVIVAGSSFPLPHDLQADGLSVTTDQDTPTPIGLGATENSLPYSCNFPLMYQFTAPAHGTLTGDPPTLTYTPDAGFHGQDFFTYQVSDDGGSSWSKMATVSITVNHSAPTANSASITTDECTPVDVILTASDSGGDPLTYEIVGEPANGTLTGDPPNLTYTPADGYSGADSFTFTATDETQEEDSNVATVSITVNVACVSMNPINPVIPTSSSCFDSTWPDWSANSAFLAATINDGIGANQFFEIDNCGDAPVTIDQPTLSGDSNNFLVELEPGTTIAPHGFDVFLVHFYSYLPDEPGCKYAHLEIQVGAGGCDLAPLQADLDGLTVLTPASIALEVQFIQDAVAKLPPLKGSPFTSLRQLAKEVNIMNQDAANNDAEGVAHEQSVCTNLDNAFKNEVAAALNAHKLSPADATNLAAFANSLLLGLQGPISF